MRAIDLFSGWGGFTSGARSAGVDVVWAANHWPLAVEVHAANHPETTHVCQDLRQADWTSLPEYDLLLASPACQGHSQAAQPMRKGKVRAHHDALRATAWAVVDCVEVTRPRALIVENVTDFQRWDKFDLWLEALRRDGYHLQLHTVNATDHGVPQRRSRLFVVGTRKPADILLPKRVSEPAFEGCLEPNASGWRPISDCRGEGARRRIEEAVRRHRGRCLVQHVTGHKGVPLSEPIRTITTKDQWVLAEGDRYRPLTKREYARGMSFDDSFTWPDTVSRADFVKGAGNAVPPLVARDLVSAVREATQ